ncbi:MAG: HEPN domain-containing protein [Clostridia bacterium]|nr:HEPN domain-containing protein [Clostridia bacterium]
MNELEDKVKYWLELARYDMDSARVMFNGGKYVYVGFMCHQTIEKALKAYYTSYHDDIPPYIHNLIRLSELSDLLSVYDDKQRQTVLSLNPLNIEARYPTRKKELELLLTNAYCKTLIIDTEELLQWIENKL